MRCASANKCRFCKPRWPAWGGPIAGLWPSLWPSRSGRPAFGRRSGGLGLAGQAMGMAVGLARGRCQRPFAEKSSETFRVHTSVRRSPGAVSGGRDRRIARRREPAESRLQPGLAAPQKSRLTIGRRFENLPHKARGFRVRHGSVHFFVAASFFSSPAIYCTITEILRFDGLSGSSGCRNCRSA